MIIQNKLEKFLAVISSLFLMAVIMLGIKIREDDKKLDKLEDNLNDYNASIADILETQKQIMANYKSTLDKVANAKAPDTFKTMSTRTVVPGKIVKKTVPKTTKTS